LCSFFDFEDCDGAVFVGLRFSKSCDMSMACTAFPDLGAKDGRDGERAAGDVFERWRVLEFLCREGD
jgi:hypothetical protein